MGRIGAIPKLPESVREALNGWLRDPGISQGEAADRTNALLEELGVEERVSRQVVNRYDLRMRKVGQELQESREVADAWIAQLGSAPGGKLGHLVTEMIRVLSFEVTLKMKEGKLTEESLPGVIKSVSQLALMSQRIERASDLSVNREAKIRRSEREKAAEAAAKSLSRQKGLSQDTIETIKKDILGVS